MALDAYAIITLADLKATLGITVTTYDTQLEQAINTATAQVEGFLGKKVIQREYFEWTTSGSGMVVVAKNPPISSIHFFGFGAATAFVVESTVSTDVMASVTVETDRIIFKRIASTGVETTDFANYSNHDVTSELVTHINTVTGFKATLTKNCPCRHLNRLAGRNLINAPATITYVDQSQHEMIADLERGVIHVGANSYSGYGQRVSTLPMALLLNYSGGWAQADVPYEIQQACRQLASGIFNARARDTSLSSESLGDYSYTLKSGRAYEQEAFTMIEPWKKWR